MSNDDTNAAADARDEPRHEPRDGGYIGRHARPGAPDQGADDAGSYDAKHQRADGPAGPTQH